MSINILIQNLPTLAHVHQMLNMMLSYLQPQKQKEDERRTTLNQLAHH